MVALLLRQHISEILAMRNNSARSHYFETALDLTYCVSGDDPKQPGFYLIMFMGSEQARLTGFEGSIVRKVAVGRSASSVQKSLTSIKETLEKNQ